MSSAPKPRVEEEAHAEIFRLQRQGVLYRLLADEEKMKLFLECVLEGPERPPALTRVELLGILPKTIPAKFFHPEVLDDIAEKLTRGEAVPPRRIAKGLAAVPGRDGKVVFLVKTFSNSGEREMVDPWFIKTFDNIEVGMTVARLYLPHPGVDGMTVLGEKIPFVPGKPANVEVDETLALEPGATYVAVVSKLSGYLRVEKSKLGVVHELVIRGDVDHQSGDIQFLGKVTVRGDVKKNFHVEAREDILIQGNVQDGRLSSTTGGITVKGHVTGDSMRSKLDTEHMPLQQRLRAADNRKAQIVCAGAFRATLIDSISVDALGDIEVEKEVRSCSLRTRGTLRLAKGTLIGGESFTVCGTEAATIGTDLETPTRIVLCSDQESSAEYGVLMEKLKAHDAALEMLRLYLGPYADNPARIPLLAPEHRKKMEGLRQKLDELQRSRKRLLDEKTELLADAKHNSVSRVNFHKRAFPGVEICAGQDRFVLDEAVAGPKTIEHRPNEHRFEIVDQQPLQCILQ